MMQTVKQEAVNGPLMIDVEGTDLSEAERALLQHSMVGGLILFTRNFESINQLQTLISDIRCLNPTILIAVDHEGGRVQRFREGFSQLPAMSELGLLYQSDEIQALTIARELGWLMAAELLALDIDISFAPILDRDHGISEVIGDRAFASDLPSIMRLTESFIKGMKDAGMAATGKHFPGHGAVEADSHVAIPVDDRDFDEISHEDMAVFKALVLKGIDAMMPAHVIYPQVDSQPAGFSSVWLQQILRQQLGFDGVIFSDDLGMEGATVAGSFANRAKLALAAGCDMVLVCNDRKGALEVLEFLEQYPPQKNTRIARMRANKSRTITINDLQKSPRWVQAQQYISAINSGMGGSQ